MPESLTQEQQDLRDRVAAFMEREVKPLEEAIGGDGRIPDDARRLESGP